MFDFLFSFFMKKQMQIDGTIKIDLRVQNQGKVFAMSILNDERISFFSMSLTFNPFYPRQELSSGIVVSGQKSCPSGGRAAGRHAFVSGPLFENYYTYIYEIWHIFGRYALVVPFGGHISIAYIVFS